MTVARHRADLDKMLLIALLLALLAAWPFWARASLPRETDAELHVFRTVEIGESLRAGEGYTRWAPDFFFGYGYPIFNYYAPLTYYLANFLTIALPGGAVLGVKLVFIFGFLLGGLGMFGSARHLIGDDRGALFAEALFLTAPYVYIIDPHLRGVLPEFFAITLAPAALWAMLADSRRRTRLTFSGASLALAGLLLSHNLIGPALFLLLAAFAVWDGILLPLILRESLSWRKVGDVLVPFAIALLCSAFFLLPVIFERDAVRLENLIAAEGHFDYHNHFVSLLTLLRPSIALDLNAMNPRVLSNLGLTQWLSALVGAAGVFITWRRDRRLALRMVFFFLSACAITFMIMPASVTIWEAIPSLAYVQFPWRFLGILALLIGLMCAPVVRFLSPLDRHDSRIGAALLLSLPLLAVLPILVPPSHGSFGEASVAAYAYFERHGGALGTTSTADYIPVGVEAPVIKDDAITAQYEADLPIDRVMFESLPEGATVTLSRNKPTDWTYTIATPESFELVLKAFSYPGWQASIDGQPVRVGIQKPEGFIRINVPSGEHVLRVWFGTTPTRSIATLISLSGVLLLIILSSRLRQPATRHQAGTAYVPVSLATIGLCASIAVIAGVSGVLQSSAGDIPLHAQEALHVQFDGGIDLLAYDIESRTLEPGESVTLRLYWRVREPVSSGYQTFVQVVSSPPQLVTSQVKLNPADYPISRWQVGETLIDEYRMLIPYGTAPGSYQVVAGLWQMATGIRQAAWLPDGTLLGDAATLPITIEITAPAVQPAPSLLAMDHAEQMPLTGGITMLGYDQDPEDPITLTTGNVYFYIYWQAQTGNLPPGEIVFRVVDDRGREVYRQTGPPADGYAPIDGWSVGQVIRDLRVFPFDADARRGLYRVDLGFLPSGETEPGSWLALGVIELAS